MSLRNSFKNFRRDYPDKRSGVRHGSPSSTSRGVEPPSKRPKAPSNDGEDLSDGYTEAVELLGAEFKKSRKQGRNQAKIKDLMEKTRERRRKWIVQDRPLVWEVVEAFPCLGSSKGVSVLCMIFTFCMYIIYNV